VTVKEFAVMGRFEGAGVVRSGALRFFDSRRAARSLAARLRTDGRYSSISVVRWQDLSNGGWTSGGAK
jgi:hypothetical protein